MYFLCKDANSQPMHCKLAFPLHKAYSQLSPKYTFCKVYPSMHSTLLHYCDLKTQRTNSFPQMYVHIYLNNNACDANFNFLSKILFCCSSITVSVLTFTVAPLAAMVRMRQVLVLLYKLQCNAFQSVAYVSRNVCIRALFLHVCVLYVSGLTHQMQVSVFSERVTCAGDRDVSPGSGL